jgi:hypothetical protein
MLCSHTKICGKRKFCVKNVSWNVIFKHPNLSFFYRGHTEYHSFSKLCEVHRMFRCAQIFFLEFLNILKYLFFSTDATTYMRQNGFIDKAGFPTKQTYRCISYFVNEIGGHPTSNKPAALLLASSALSARLCRRIFANNSSLRRLGVDLRGSHPRVSKIQTTGASESLENLHLSLTYVYKCDVRFG